MSTKINNYLIEFGKPDEDGDVFVKGCFDKAASGMKDAIIKVNGIPIGRMKSVKIQEEFKPLSLEGTMKIDKEHLEEFKKEWKKIIEGTRNAVKYPIFKTIDEEQSVNAYAENQYLKWKLSTMVEPLRMFHYHPMEVVDLNGPGKMLSYEDVKKAAEVIQKNYGKPYLYLNHDPSKAIKISEPLRKELMSAFDDRTYKKFALGDFEKSNDTIDAMRYGMCRCNPGIEPIFDQFYKRRILHNPCKDIVFNNDNFMVAGCDFGANNYAGMIWMKARNCGKNWVVENVMRAISKDDYKRGVDAMLKVSHGIEDFNPNTYAEKMLKREKECRSVKEICDEMSKNLDKYLQKSIEFEADFLTKALKAGPIMGRTSFQGLYKQTEQQSHIDGECKLKPEPFFGFEVDWKPSDIDIWRSMEGFLSAIPIKRTTNYKNKYLKYIKNNLKTSVMQTVNKTFPKTL